MEFTISDLDTKIKDIPGVLTVRHDRTLREQITMDEKEFGVDPADLDSFDNVELNIHIDYLVYMRSMERD